jgi:hypothetical protein
MREIFTRWLISLRDFESKLLELRLLCGNILNVDV